MSKKVFPRMGRDVRRGERLPDQIGAWHKRRYNAFTLIELIVVVGIIAILSAFVLSTVGYARKKSAFARAETEIAAMSAACENYKADNGIYPRGQSSSVPVSGTPTYTVAATGTDDLNARSDTDST